MKYDDLVEKFQSLSNPMKKYFYDLLNDCVELQKKQEAYCRQNRKDQKPQPTPEFEPED